METNKNLNNDKINGLELQDSKLQISIEQLQRIARYQMSRQMQRQPLGANAYQNHRLRTYKDNSFISNNENNNSHNQNFNPQTVDFQQYLYTEHFSPSEQHCQSIGYIENGSSKSSSRDYSSNDQNSQHLMQNEKILIEIGENYTFADQMSSHRKPNRKNINLNCFPQLNKKLINIYPFSIKNKNNKPPQFKFSSTSSLLIPSQSQISSRTSSNQISLSDNDQDQGLMIYKTKELEQEMFLKISEQTKQILKLQEKLYYYEDFSKRLLKSEQQSTIVKKNLATEIKLLKKKSKAKTNAIKELQAKLIAKQKEIQQLKQSNSQVVSQYRSNQRASSLTKRQGQRITLLEKQNFQNITLLQSRNKLITQKYQILLQKYQKMQTKSFDLERQLQKYKKDYEILKKKNLNSQNMNKILQKEISELNIKFFQMQSQMQKVTYDKYASNLIRIKNFNCQAFKDNISKKNQLITEAFETTGPLSIKRS